MDVKIGSTVGNWIVLTEWFIKNNVRYHTCKCICGIQEDVQRWKLNNSKTKGCGCTEFKIRKNYEGIGDLSKSYFTSFKRSRENKGKVFSKEITLSFLWDLFIKQNKKCALSGLDITLNPEWSAQNNGKNKSLKQSASIDRKDSLKNYTPDNIQWVHKTINLMKGQLTDSDFIEICKKVSENNNISRKEISNLKWRPNIKE